MPIDVVHAIISREGAQGHEVLLGRRANTGYGNGYYSFPAGHVEPGETLLIALEREMFEEAGIVPVFNQIAQEPVLVISHLKDYGPAAAAETRFRDYRENYFAVGTHWKGELRNNEPHRCDDLRYIPLVQLPDNVLPLTMHALGCLEARTKRSRFGWDNPAYQPSGQLRRT